MTYSLDFRKKVLEVRKSEGLSIVKTANLFSISPTTVMEWTKNIIAKVGRNKPATKINMQELVKDVKKFPDAYLYERAKRLGCSGYGICCALKRLGVTYKKNSKSPKGERRSTAYLPEEN